MTSENKCLDNTLQEENTRVKFQNNFKKQKLIQDNLTKKRKKKSI